MQAKLAAVSGALVCALMAGCGGSSGGGGGTVQPTITSVTVTMSASTFSTAQTSQATATVTGTGAYSSAVTWSLTPSTAGTITTSGLFTPSAAGSVTVTATSTEDPTKSGTATVTVSQGPKIVVGPGMPTVFIGASQQFTATVSGEGTNTGVTWSVDAGTITSGGLYQSPYPAPATATVTATSTADTTLSGSTTVTLAPPATANGPVLIVDAGNMLHPINPLVYGMNAYVLDQASATTAGTTLTRWGGDDTSRYNYQTGNSNSASDYYFQNGAGSGGMLPNPTGSSTFTQYVTAAHGLGADVKVLGSMNVMGWVTNSSTTACSYPQSTYPGQVSYSPQACGDGMYPNGTQGCTSSGGCNLTIPAGQQATFAAVTSDAEPPPTAPGAGKNTQAWAQGTWQGGWVNSIVTNASFGSSASKRGVDIWDLDNEPAWWDAVHRDVHPIPSTYDEVTQGGIGAAVAIKTVDPTAMVSGPIIDYWWNYFYSKQDIENGWAGQGTVKCYQQWDNPTDREAHGGVAMIPYYLEQMNLASGTYGTRLLDILDIHGYFAGSYNGNSVAFTTAGDTGEQFVREDSVRALWDPTYTNTNYPQPNYMTDPNYTSSCNVPLQAPEAVPLLHAWVNGVAPLGDPANNYPGTMTAIDEYNFGGLESINGAVTQADVLGVFGQYGLDMGSFWPTTNYSQQGPVNYSFAMYRNYDLKNDGAVFGDQALASCSTSAALSGACTPIDSNYQPVAGMESGQDQLSVYGALRTRDNALTVMVINKTWGPLTSSLSLLNVTTPGTVTGYQYSNASLTSIQPITTGFTVTGATLPSTTSTLQYTFPAQSITLFVIPQ
ncbi:MAG TPA: glycoside hydrolase family 44 protein [Acidobacteriaceae bacterium]|nr:glycoside hydrolase family 44 protein [Acidobacteriaceae bacterium]